MTRILVTGASGFLGANLIRQLVKQGERPIAIIRPGSNQWRLNELTAQLEIFPCDLVALDEISISKLAQQFASVSTIYHLAASGVDLSPETTRLAIQTNAMSTFNILNLARQIMVKSVVLTGSCFEYTPGSCLDETTPLQPKSEYAATKAGSSLMALAFHRKYQLPLNVVRPFTIYGPLEAPYRLIPYVISHLLENRPIPLTQGRQTRDWLYVHDAVEGLIMAAANPLGQTFNLCTGQETSVKALVEKIAQLMKQPLSYCDFGAKLDRPDEIWSLAGNPARAQAILGWYAKTSLDEGLSSTIKWFSQARQRYPIYSLA